MGPPRPKTPRGHRSSPKSPSPPRTLSPRDAAPVALLCLLALCPTAAQAQPATTPRWTADEAVREALKNPAIQATLQGQRASARAALRVRTARPTPTINVSHAQAFANGATENIELNVVVQQQLDLTGWRAQLRRALPHRLDALDAQTRTRRLEIATQTRTAFYTVRYHQQRLQLADRWITQLTRTEKLIQARVKAGEASASEGRRLRAEVHIARLKRAQIEAELNTAWATLRVWAPWTTRPTLRGDLAPAPPPPYRAPALPSIQALQHQERALAEELRAWGTPALRNWTFGAGYRYLDEGAVSAHGFILSISGPIPLWNNDRPRIDQLEAERARITSELRLRRAWNQRARRAARDRLNATRDALASHDRNARAQQIDGDALIRDAEQAYRAGEGTLYALLDAHRNANRLRNARLDLQWAARRAAIALARSRGRIILDPRATQTMPATGATTTRGGRK